MKTTSFAVLALVLSELAHAQADAAATPPHSDPDAAVRQRRSDVQAAAGQTARAHEVAAVPVRRLSPAQRSELRWQLGQNRPAGFEPASPR